MPTRYYFFLSQRSFLRPMMLVLMMLLGMSCSSMLKASEDIMVYAATSCWQVLEDIRKAYLKHHHDANVVIVYGASGYLARQISYGAPAHIYISADPRWSTWLARHQDILMWVSLATNRLVLMTYRGSLYDRHLSLATQTLEAMLEYFLTQPTFRFALADPEISPSGAYGREALIHLNIWKRLQPHTLLGADVGNVLSWIRLEVLEAGIVYLTDAKVIPNGRILALIPTSLHRPIEYRMSLLKNVPPEASTFYAFIQEYGQNIFMKAGFEMPISQPLADDAS